MTPVLALAVALVTTGCADDEPPGRALYAQPLAGGNTFACATCHALSEPSADGLRRPGHPIGDATRRPSYKGGALTDMLDAVNTCLVDWMTADPWTADDPDWLALRDYLDGQATARTAPALTLSVRQPPADVSGGDAAAGRALFNTSCVVCHGEDAVGSERAPPLLGSLLAADYVAERVRTSGPTGQTVYDGLTGGRMPFWSEDRLSDDELRDVVAFVLSNDPGPQGPDGGVDEPDAGGGDCDSTHPRVGQTAQFTTLFHGVMGTARIVDDCTIVIEDFHYDGTGIDVRVYGAIGGNFDDGFAMSGDLLKAGGYAGDTITARIPDGMSLDDLDGISIWCVTVGQSFGDAFFPAL